MSLFAHPCLVDVVSYTSQSDDAWDCCLTEFVGFSFGLVACSYCLLVRRASKLNDSLARREHMLRGTMQEQEKQVGNVLYSVASHGLDRHVKLPHCLVSFKQPTLLRSVCRW